MKNSFGRRVISLTLAASVVLPQASPVFAISLTDESLNSKIQQAISGTRPSAESTMPRLSLSSRTTKDNAYNVSQDTTLTTPPNADDSGGGTTGTDDGATESPGRNPSSGSDNVTTPADSDSGGGGTTKDNAYNVSQDTTLSTPPDADDSGGGTTGTNNGATESPGFGSSSSSDVTTPTDGDDSGGGTTGMDDGATESPGLGSSLGSDVTTPTDGDDSGGGTTGTNSGTTESPGLGSSSGSNVATPQNGGIMLSSTLTSSDTNTLSKKMRYYLLGYGVPLEGGSNKRALGDLTAISGADFKGLFNVETTAEQYGYRNYKNSLFDKSVNNEITGDLTPEDILKMNTICVFPTDEVMGRVPDMEFVGWYYYPKGAKTLEQNGDGADKAADWYYGDIVGQDRPDSPDDNAVKWEEEDIKSVPIEEFTEENIYYSKTPNSDDYGSTFGELGDKWDGGYDYGYGYQYEYDEDGNPKYDSTWAEFGYYYYDDGDGETNPVSFVAKWKESDESKVSEIKVTGTTANNETTDVTLYENSVVGKTAEALESETEATTTNNSGLEESTYYLRVGADVETVTIDLSTLELYFKDYVRDTSQDTSDGKYDYSYERYSLNTAQTHLTVTVNGENFDGEKISARMFPQWTTTKDYNGLNVYTAKNSVGEPAHSEWKISNIPLTQATKENAVNTIEVTVTSPSGEQTTKYTFVVERLTEPTLTQGYGNTPLGMVWRDTVLESDEVKQAVENYFIANYKFDFDSTENGTQYPTDSVNNLGAIYRGSYSSYAWGKENNVDLDKSAIVVYQNSTFRDVGLSLTGSEGTNVDSLAGTLYRTIQLQTADTIDPTKLGTDGYGEKCWYDVQEGKSVLSDTKCSQAVSVADGTDVIDFRGLDILPGVYTISYEYEDPVSGKRYPRDYLDSESDKIAAYTKTLVVLPTPGDVDMDGAVTAADAVALKKMLSIKNGYTYLNDKLIAYEGMTNRDEPNELLSLFAYRVCDINGDGKVNEEDVEALRSLPNPKVNSDSDRQQSDYFYLPLSGGTEITRQDLTTSTTLAGVEMVYLGKEGGKLQESGWTNITGPWSGSLSPTEDKVELDDVFWLGVQLKDVDSLSIENITSFTFTLVYDSTYLEPTVVGQTTSTTWQEMMATYNLHNAAENHTVWKTTSGTYEMTVTAGYGNSFSEHSSTAVIPLEKSSDAKLKTLTFSVELEKGTGVSLNSACENLYLFAVPFKLVEHPFGQEKAQLVEFEAGMRGFTIVTEQDSTLTTYAYNADFGGTENLADYIGYRNAGAEIPLGEDKSVVYYVYNMGSMDNAITNSQTRGVYASEFYSKGGWLSQQDQETSDKDPYLSFTINQPLQGTLPNGLTYNKEYGYLEGIPLEAGTFKFSVGRTNYVLVIDQAELRFWAVNASTYYGEQEYRGENSTDFSFRYAVGDICEPELTFAQENSFTVSGAGSELTNILNIGNLPTFKAVDESGAAVTNATPANATYEIQTTFVPEHKNYKLVYSPEMVRDEDPANEMGLTIRKRPILVERINGSEGSPTVVATIYNDDDGTLPNLKAGTVGSDNEVTFTATLPETTDGKYNGLTLTTSIDYTDGVILQGDSLKISYEIKYIRNEQDIYYLGEDTYHFYLMDLEEYRDVTVSKIELLKQEGTSWQNYNIMAKDPVTPTVSGEVVGKVQQRRVELLQIVNLPKMNYTYGDPLTTANDLTFRILKDGDQVNGDYSYTEENVAKLMIEVYWATAEEKNDYEANNGKNDPNYSAFDDKYSTDRKEFKPGQQFTTDYNGMYICLSKLDMNNEGEAVKVRLYSASPVTVEKRTLTLTATAMSRYYGEDHQAGLTFTYDKNQLFAADSREGLTGAGEELAEIFSSDDNYKQPILKAVVTLPETENDLDTVATLNRKSGRGDGYVMIYGAESTNYKFVYQFTKNAQSGTVTRDDFGAAAYKIERRPIVVEAVTTDRPLVELYADTKQIYTEGKSLAQNEVKLSLPTTVYYSNDGKEQKTLQTFAEGATAVVAGDKLTFQYTATVISKDGKDYVKYTDFSRGYFNMNEGVSEEGYKEYPVQISNLRLAEEGAYDNYVIVYRTEDKAVRQTVENAVADYGIEPEVSENNFYYKAMISTEGSEAAEAKARVYLRPIESIEFISTGRVSYTYGDPYSPAHGEYSSQGMKLKITYTSDDKDNYEGNTTFEEVTFGTASILDGKVTTSFDTRSLKIYYVKDGQTIDQAIAANQLLEQGGMVTVTEHNGAKLAVTGKRGAQSEEIRSELTAATLKITPKNLSLKAKDEKRFYGESNPVFTYSFPASQLAEWDRTALDVEEDAELTSLDLERLVQMRDWDDEYRQPQFATEATRDSEVVNGGKGGYEITLTDVGTIPNYVFTYEQDDVGILYIYPRPVRIESFIQNRPVYTIYSDLSGNVYDIELSTNWYDDVDGKTVSQFTLGRDDFGVIGGEVLPLTGNALYGDDEMIVKAQVTFPNGISKESQEYDVTVGNVTLMAGTAAANNYVFMIGQDGGAAIVNNKAKGQVDLRTISTITVSGTPKLNYVYGDSLDLSDLVVTIDYENDPTKRKIVNYIGPGQFAQYGLYVYYYKESVVRQDSEQIRKNGRTAQTGDHVTVAYTHDSMIDGTYFATNGMYLVVTAETHDGDNVIYAEPKIVPNKNGGAGQLTVQPREITYTLSAEDKIYDGNIQAAGTITFTNIFTKSGVVDSWNENGVTDMVYPVLNATYEQKWQDGIWKHIFVDFEKFVTENGYAFTTGEYVPNDPDKPTENATIQWTEGYEWGNGMSFTYLDPNVAYEGDDFTAEPTEKTLHIINLTLSGPDAANYKLVGKTAGETVEVTTNNATGLLDEELPTATIHKANRANLTDTLLPNVELDPHTNVVRLYYDQTTDIITRGSAEAASGSEIKHGEEERYLDQVHFEYALQLLQTDGTTNVIGVKQWAGANGEKDWDTGMFFGGEARKPDEITTEDTENHDPYVPDPEDLPTEDSITEETVWKGQIYQWAEEDDGFYIDPSLYPGGEIWLGYDLYSTNRSPLERDAVYVPVVRAAETHNYNASLPISSLKDYIYTAITAVLEAQAALEEAEREHPQETLDAEKALAKALTDASEALSEAVTTAYADAQAEVDLLTAEGSTEAETRPAEYREPTVAVKTYKQMIETMSLTERNGINTASTEPYLVPTLEAVWFTDVVNYTSQDLLDVVLWNKEPVRYSTYAWDNTLSAELEISEETPLDLSEPLEVTVTKRRENGGDEVEELVTVNVDNTAKLYVDITFPNESTGVKPTRIVLRPGSILAAVGDDPVTVGVTLYPFYATAKMIVWTSSNPNVARVSSSGVVSFVGAGTATITATVPSSYLGSTPACSASIEITVVENWKNEYPNSIFDFGYTDSFLTTDVAAGESEEVLFRPTDTITRGEVAQVLAQFYVENPAWNQTGPDAYSDLTGEEDYADEVLLLSRVGVFKGYPEGSFNGDQAISRAEFVTLLARMTGVTVTDTAGQEHAFRDVNEETTWAYAEIDAMSQIPGLLQGVGDGYFEPNRAITRSEVAAVLTRLLRFSWVQDGDLVVPTDITEDFWGRESVLRALNGITMLEESL